MKKQSPTTALAVAFVCFAAAPAFSHGDEPHGKAPHAPPAATTRTPTAARGSHQKEHPKPHGGKVFVIDASDHLHAEVVFDEGGLHLWFYDDQMKPLPPPPEARATLVVGKDVRKLELKPIEKCFCSSPGDDEFADKQDAHLAVATPLPQDGKLALVVQATVNGKLRSGRVEREPAASSTTTPPSAPMPAATTPSTTTP